MKPKIIQILIGTQDSTYQGRLIGLGDNGVVYATYGNGLTGMEEWRVFMPAVFEDKEVANEN